MSELRWVLLLIGLVFLAALTLWERRRPRQASPSATPERSAPREPERSGARGVREPLLSLPEIRAREPTSPLPTLQLEAAAAQLQPAAAEPLAAERATPVEPEELDERDEIEEPGDCPPTLSARQNPAAHAPEAESGPTEPAEASASAAPAREALPELPAAPPPLVEWPPDEQRRILALRLVAQQPQRFPGRSLRQALAAEGFVLGRFAIFHKPDDARRAVLSAASLNRPGTFDADTMDSQHYGGLSLFAVLPGPKAPSQAFDELVFTARSLNDRLHGVLQDEQGGPLTPARIATLRERLSTGVTS
jgi:cell division protein ZipA